MLAALVVTGLVILAWPLAAGVSRPATGRTRGRDADRRTRFVSRNPHEVNAGDIRRMLAAGGLGPEQVHYVSTRAAELGIGPFMMLVWLKRFDPHALATVVAADLSQHQLIAHISNGTVPDLEELRVFAELNGYTAVPVPRSSPLAPTPGPATDRMAAGPSAEEWAIEDGVPVTLESMGLYHAPSTSQDGESDANQHMT